MYPNHALDREMQRERARRHTTLEGEAQVQEHPVGWRRILRAAWASIVALLRG